ncbi:hypothetical protein EBZ39_12860 [bacterium]|nr:hypothetical protein [bacterium]
MIWFAVQTLALCLLTTGADLFGSTAPLGQLQAMVLDCFEKIERSKCGSRERRIMSRNAGIPDEWEMQDNQYKQDAVLGIADALASISWKRTCTADISTIAAENVPERMVTLFSVIWWHLDPSSLPTVIQGQGEMCSIVFEGIKPPDEDLLRKTLAPKLASDL